MIFAAITYSKMKRIELYSWILNMLEMINFFASKVMTRIYQRFLLIALRIREPIDRAK